MFLSPKDVSSGTSLSVSIVISDVSIGAGLAAISYFAVEEDYVLIISSMEGSFGCFCANLLLPEEF